MWGLYGGAMKPTKAELEKQVRVLKRGLNTLQNKNDGLLNHNNSLGFTVHVLEEKLAKVRSESEAQDREAHEYADLVKTLRYDKKKLTDTNADLLSQVMTLQNASKLAREETARQVNAANDEWKRNINHLAQQLEKQERESARLRRIARLAIRLVGEVESVVKGPSE